MKDKEFNEIIKLLGEVCNDECTPKLVKIRVRNIQNSLGDSCKSVSMRIDKCLQELDGMGEDTGIPANIKTQIWDIVSKLESIPQ